MPDSLYILLFVVILIGGTFALDWLEKFIIHIKKGRQKDSIIKALKQEILILKTRGGDK